MQQSVNLQKEIINWIAVLRASKYLSSPNYSSVPKKYLLRISFWQFKGFVDNIVSKCKEVWDTIEKRKTTITDVKYDFLNVVRGKTLENLLYVKDGDQE